MTSRMLSPRTSSGPRPREARVPTTPICDDARTCNIKDAQPQNIAWTPPQGGSGPNYPNM
ncbi:4Fe-4S dicluster domain-containing protein [Aeromonas sp. Marseille-Q5825]|uniref:4Fe-4S dicluster domain-containing protein n=1 Tax=Aeromonas sp. Marseille-Q5825 TaxID=2972767 RepID=UPI003967AB4A